MNIDHFTKDELDIIYTQMQMESDDWEDYWSPESFALIKSIMDKIWKHHHPEQPTTNEGA